MTKGSGDSAPRAGGVSSESAGTTMICADGTMSVLTLSACVCYTTLSVTPRGQAALVQLAVFLGGGVLAPVWHLAHHRTTTRTEWTGGRSPWISAPPRNSPTATRTRPTSSRPPRWRRRPARRPTSTPGVRSRIVHCGQRTIQDLTPTTATGASRTSAWPFSRAGAAAAADAGAVRVGGGRRANRDSPSPRSVLPAPASAPPARAV